MGTWHLGLFVHCVGSPQIVLIQGSLMAANVTGVRIKALCGLEDVGLCATAALEGGKSPGIPGGLRKCL